MDQLQAFAKFVLSFLKKEWTVTDYPLRFRRQAGDPEWSVQVINWWPMTGLGESKQAALSDLGRHLEERRVDMEAMPRPGTRVPLEFSSTGMIESRAPTARVFVTDVLGFGEDDPVFISDESSLWDFSESDTLDDLQSKITAVFGVDVSAITDGNIAEILEKIDENQQGGMEFTRLEQALLSWIRDHCDPTVAKYLGEAQLKSRDWTGAGLFVHLDYGDRAGVEPKAPFDCDPICGPEITSPQLPDGAGSVLFVTDGVPDVLEVFAYGDEFPSELLEFSLAESSGRTE